MGKQKKHSKDKPNRRKDKQERGTRDIKEKFVEERQHRAPPIEAKTANQKKYMGACRVEKIIVAPFSLN